MLNVFYLEALVISLLQSRGMLELVYDGTDLGGDSVFGTIIVRRVGSGRLGHYCSSRSHGLIDLERLAVLGAGPEGV